MPERVRDGMALPAEGQTLVSRNGREWEVLRVWDVGPQMASATGRFGAVVRLKGERPQVRTIRLDVPGGWKLRLPDRAGGQWRACPSCGGRFGAVARCPWDDVLLVELEIRGGDA